ncbi:MAG: hypothetical protein KAS32_21720 [Candidatus Peribacteraceae bacterium]|nr:hypothetical protein [Candidatus Peribacteraceae bacterium]
MSKVTLEDREKQTGLIVNYIQHKELETDSANIKKIYNMAIRDAIDFTKEMAKHNKQFGIQFNSLAVELEVLKLVENSEDDKSSL